MSVRVSIWVMTRLNNACIDENSFEKFALAAVPYSLELLDARVNYAFIHGCSRNHRIWLVAGSIPERGTDGKLYNCSMTFDPTGKLIGTYRKLHLFDIDIPGNRYGNNDTRLHI